MIIRRFTRRNQFYILRRQCISSSTKEHVYDGGEVFDLHEKQTVFKSVFSKRAFPTRSTDCEVLKTPRCFHQNILKHIRSSKHRISLASLYFGTGKKETEIVEEIRTACVRNPKLQVRILLDHSRGTRKSPIDGTSSISMLSSLCNEFPGQFSLSLFLMPQLWSESASWIPARWNEIVSVMHVKAYVFDNTLMMSGANLSEDYFTNRQDRYLVIHSTDRLAGLYHDFVRLLSRFSDIVTTEIRPIERNSALRDRLQDELHDFAASYQNDDNSSNNHQSDVSNNNYDSWIVPTFQFGELDLFHDDETISRILKGVPYNSVDFATGYFNMPESLINLLIHDCDIQKVRVLMSSPEAHGFHSAKGISGALPLAYAERSRLFFERINKLEESSNISLYEYFRDNWTFHAKGIWLTCNSENLPWLSVIGSSNFGMRSHCRDIESQLYVCTTDKTLRQSWNRERTSLWNHANEVNEALLSEESRQIKGMSLRSGYWIRPVSRLIARFM